MEKYHEHEFQIQTHTVNPFTKTFYYVIYDKLSNSIESKEHFISEQQARFAAIGHISLLEIKENNND